ncbi:MAG TPA: glycosyltransferase family 2 protein [Gemmatimonadales bacterium]|nr:glycosyltransferase family 2 protein [Gemmatimonadales bacterium]
MPRVSIGVPVYNGARYLRESLDGLLAQTFTDFELVIADNASTDATEAICREYVARDPRVRYHRNERNLGGPGNFRRVFRLCRGEYHKWSTADDLWHPTFVEKCVAVLEARPDVVLAYPRSNIVDAAGAVIRTFDDPLDLPEASPSVRVRRVIEESTLCHAHLGVIRRSAMLHTGLIGSELASDIRFLAEMAMLGKFAVVPEHLFGRRFHEASSSWAREDAEWQRRYYAPGRSGVARFGTWRRYTHLLLRAARIPIPLADRWELLRFLGRRMRWQRGVLARELIQSAIPARQATVTHPR